MRSNKTTFSVLTDLFSSSSKMRACAFLSLGLVFEANKRVIRADGFQLSLELGKNKISPLRIPLNHII